MNSHSQGLMRQYFKEEDNIVISRLKPLPGKFEERTSGQEAYSMDPSNEDLCRMYQEGNRGALSILANKNRNLLYSRAYKCNNKFNHKLEIDDLVQWGFIGMMKAADRFDTTFGTKFTTYAVWWIDQSISRAIIDEGYTIRLPVHIFEKIEKVHSVIRNNQSLSGEKLIKIISRQLKLSLRAVKEILVLYSYILNIGSLYSPVGEDGDSFLVDFIGYDEDFDVETEVEKSVLKEEINNILNTLMPREQNILEMRYGLNGYEPHTLEEIGLIYNLTRERIRQIQERALRKLRHPSRGKYLEEFLYKK